jgi:hypothetical protein
VRKRKTWRESEQLFYVQSQEGAALETHTPSILSRRLSKASQSSTEGLKLVNWIARRQSLLCQPAADQQHFRDGHAHDDINSGRGLIKAQPPGVKESTLYPRAVFPIGRSEIHAPG